MNQQGHADRSAFTYILASRITRGAHVGNSSMRSAHQFETAFETKAPRVDPLPRRLVVTRQGAASHADPKFLPSPLTSHRNLLARSRLRPHRTWSGSETCRRLKGRPTSLHRDDYNPSIKPGAHPLRIHCASISSR